MVAKAMLGTEGKNSCCVIPLLIVLFVSGCTAVSHSVTAVTKNGALLVLYAVASHTRLIGLGIRGSGLFQVADSPSRSANHF